MFVNGLGRKRRLKCEKLTDDRRQVMTKAHVAFGKVSNSDTCVRVYLLQMQFFFYFNAYICNSIQVSL